MDAAGTSYSAITTGYPYDRDRGVHDRDRLEYELTVRQEPKQARMCGVGSDRRPIDPPPIIQLRVIDKRTRQPPSHPEADDSDPTYAHSFLQNPYYFMFASLAKPDDDAELHWLKDGKTRCTTGSVVSSLYHLKDTENRNEDAGFFVFPDLSVRTEGSYRLKLSLFEVVGNTVRHCKSIYSSPFYVYTAKKFPGMEESTPLSCSLADQGIKIRIRKDIRVRKRPIAALTNPIEGEKADDEREDEHPNNITPPSGTIGKRARHGPNNPINANADLPTPTSANPIALAGLPAWPTTTLDPMLGVASAPGGIELTSPTHFGPTSAGAGSTIPPPPGATYEGAKAPPTTIPPPPGAHIMPPQATAYEGSNTRQTALSSAVAHNRQVQPLTPTYPPSSSQSLSPTGPPAPQQQPVYETPGQRVGYETPRSTYESNRSFDQTQSRAYEGTRTGYDHATQRGSYDTSARSSYDSQAQRSSFGQPYDASTQPDGQGQPHAYPHHQASYSGANHASPTHAYSPHPSSSQQTQQQPTHDSPYPPPPSRFQSQYGTPPIHNYGQPGSYTQTQQTRYDYSQQQQQYGSGTGAGAYYDSPQSQATTVGGAVQQDPQQPQQQSYYAPSHSSSGHSSSSWGTPTAPPGAGTTAGSASTHPQQSGHSQGYTTPAPSQGSYDYTHASQSYSGNSGGTGEFYSHASAAAAASSSHAPPRGGSPDHSPISAGGARYGAASASSGYPNGEPYPRAHPHPHPQAQVQQHAFSQHEWAAGPAVQGARSASVSAPTPAGWGSASAGSTGTAGEMIHLAPLRHVHGHSPTPSSPGAGGGGGPGPGPGPGYSALLPGVSHAHPHAQVHPHAHSHVQNPHALPHAHSPAHGHAHLHGGHTHVSFEGETAPAIAGARGIGGAGGGKKSVLSIGSIISEGG